MTPVERLREAAATLTEWLAESGELEQDSVPGDAILALSVASWLEEVADEFDGNGWPEGEELDWHPAMVAAARVLEVQAGDHDQRHDTI